MNASQFNIYDVVESLMQDLQKNVPFTYTIDNKDKTAGGSYEDKGNLQDGRNHLIHIFIGDEDEYVQDGIVNEKKLVGLISTILHEYRHLEQVERYKYNPDFSKLSVNIARLFAIQVNGFANYYFENYRNDPKELDATKYGFEGAIKYVKEHYPEIDVEKAIVEYVNDYIQEDRNNEYGFHMFDENMSHTTEEIIKQLQERLANPTRVPLTQVCDGYVEDDILYKVISTDEFIKKYESCKTAEEKDALIFAEVLRLHPEILNDFPVLENQINNKNKSKTAVEVKREKGADFEKTTRFLNGIEINSTKEFEDGSYSNQSRVFVKHNNTDITTSSNFINYTSYKQEYNAKTKTYTDKTQSPLIDSNGNVIGEQECIEILDSENGIRQINIFSTIEESNGNYYQLEQSTIAKGAEISEEVWSLTVDNKLANSKEEIKYTNKDGRETYIYMENGVIGTKVTKTDRGTTIDIYKDGQPYETYEYDRDGNALLQMAGLEKLPDNYVKSCFEVAIPDYEVILHEEPEEIYAIDEAGQAEQEAKPIEVSTQNLGKETLDKSKDVNAVDDVQSQMYKHIKEHFTEKGQPQNSTKGKESHTKTATDELVDEILYNFENNIDDDPPTPKNSKKDDHKVEKGDNDYIDHIM